MKKRNSTAAAAVAAAAVAGNKATKPSSAGSGGGPSATDERHASYLDEELRSLMRTKLTLVRPHSPDAARCTHQPFHCGAALTSP